MERPNPKSICICVAQIFNLLYRRFAIGTPPNRPAILEFTTAAFPFWPQQVRNLRYDRLKICATFYAPDDARKKLRFGLHGLCLLILLASSSCTTKSKANIQAQAAFAAGQQQAASQQ